jgi:predicted membrane-bound spermidine synthase
MTLPLITRMLLTGGVGERAIGSVYAWNTLGSIVGAGAAGLLLMPLIGLKGVLIAGAVVDLALGAWLLIVAARTEPAARTLAFAAAPAMAGAVAVATLAIRFDQRVLGSGVYRTGTIEAPSATDVLYYQDGRTATVSVKRGTRNQFRTIATNGKPDASLGPAWFEPCDPTKPKRPITGDASTQALSPMVALAHVPKARTAAVIGHGSGMSSHFLLGSPHLREVVTIEIEPAMIEGARAFYPANRRVYDDPRARFAIDDAKSYFASSNRTFDLIVSEPSNPWVSGVAGLFTAEFYGRVQRYLSDEGIFAQWITCTR